MNFKALTKGIKGNIIDGTAIAHEIETEIKEAIKQHEGRPPALAVILVGNHPPSEIYVQKKAKASEKIGIKSIKLHFPETITERELLEHIERLNQDPSVDGILVQLPLPRHINTSAITFAINPKKDVDGFHPLNTGMLLNGDTHGMFPCTPLGVKTMLDRLGISITGQRIVVIGRSNIVGKPMVAMLMQRSQNKNAIITILDKGSSHIKEHCQVADIIIIAIGQPRFLKEDMVKEGAIVIDIGINRVDNPNTLKGYEVIGDADFDALKDKCSYITPVPGGVGPMTIAMLLSNTYKSFSNRQ